MIVVASFHTTFACTQPGCEEMFISQAGAGLPIFGKSLVKVSEYGADQYTAVAPVCVLFSGAHYDLLVQQLAER